MTHKEPAEKLYVFVCKGDACTKQGKPERVRVALKQMARDFPAKTVKVSYVSCLGMCGEGPNVLVCGGKTAYHRCVGTEADEVRKELRGMLGKPDS